MNLTQITNDEVLDALYEHLLRHGDYEIMRESLNKVRDSYPKFEKYNSKLEEHLKNKEWGGED